MPPINNKSNGSDHFGRGADVFFIFRSFVVRVKVLLFTKVLLFMKVLLFTKVLFIYEGFTKVLLFTKVLFYLFTKVLLFTKILYETRKFKLFRSFVRYYLRHHYYPTFELVSSIQ